MAGRARSESPSHAGPHRSPAVRLPYSRHSRSPAGQLLLRPGSSRPERRRGDDGAPAVRRVRPATHRLLLVPRRQAAEARQRQPPLPGRQRPGDPPGGQAAGRRALQVRRDQRDDGRVKGQRGGSDQHPL